MLVWALAGCASPSPPPQWHSLVATAGSAAANATAAGGARPAALAVGRATVPEVYDRPELVMLSSGGTTVIREGQRWSEPLKAQWPRALALALSDRLPGTLVSAYPAPAAAPSAAQLGLELQRFELDEARAQARLRVLWRLKTGDAAAAPISRITEAVVPAADGSPRALVGAMRQALDKVADEVAAAARQ